MVELSGSDPSSQEDRPAWDDLTIAVPAYSRPRELRQLLHSLVNMTTLPGEVVLCEDNSPQRAEIRGIAAEWRSALARRGADLLYVENAENLGYDGNLRQLFTVATRRWVMLLGNDDAVLPEAAGSIAGFLARNPQVKMVSRSYLRFFDALDRPTGITSLSDRERIYKSANADPGMLMRLCGFVGGLVIDREWALRVATEKYDGTLYYQLYLAALAFCDTGIGYIPAPIVGSRVGNPPLFGAASRERQIYVPGSYTPRARVAMWRGVLRICGDIERQTSVPLVRSMRRELSGKQSFHVFEMISVQGRRATVDLVREFSHLGVMRHPLPWALALLGMLLGRHVGLVFKLLRAGQRWSAGANVLRGNLPDNAMTHAGDRATGNAIGEGSQPEQ